MKTINKKSTIFIMVSVMISILVASLDLTIVTTGMPKIIESLNGFEYYAWPMIAFSLTMAISMPLFGKLADLYGFKPIYIFGIIIFLLGSILCGISQSMIPFILFRGIQGIGGAILVSNSLAVVGILFPPADRTKYMGIFGTGGILATIAGPSFGGIITDHLSWRWLFYINIPIGIIAVVLILLATFPNYDDQKIRKQIDYFGALILVVALVPMLLAFTWGGKDYAWNSVQLISMLVFSFVMLVLFVFVELKANDPIVPLSLFKKSVFNFSAVEMFLINGVLISVITFLPLFIQRVMGYSASKSGNMITPLMISMTIAMIIGGIIISKTKQYKIQAIIGIAIMIAGCWMLSTLTVQSRNLQVILDMTVFGFGAGISSPIFTSVAQSGFSESQMSVVTSNIQFFKTLGQTIAPSILGTVLNHQMSGHLAQLKVNHLTSGLAKFFTDPSRLSNLEAVKAVKLKLSVTWLAQFNYLIEQVKHIFSSAIHEVFIICLIISIIALIFGFFMKEIPLVDTVKRD